MKLEEKIKKTIKDYEKIIASQEKMMDDDGKFPQGDYNEMQAELDCYIIFKGVLERLLEE